MLIKLGFYKITWDGRVKIFCKDLGEERFGKPYRLMIIPQWESEKMWRVEIWTPEIGGRSLTTFSITALFIEETINFMERWFKQTK
jgi:hypothetical protein